MPVTPEAATEAPKPTGNKPPAIAPPPTPSQVRESLKSQSIGFQRLFAAAPPKNAPTIASTMHDPIRTASSPSGSIKEIGEFPAYLYGLKYCAFGSG